MGIYLNLHFFEDSGRQCHFVTKKNILNKSVCTKFKVSIVFHLVRGCDTNRQTNNTHIYEDYRNFPTGCSPHVDLIRHSNIYGKVQVRREGFMPRQEWPSVIFQVVLICHKMLLSNYDCFIHGYY